MGKISSAYFNLSNSVRQGGVLSLKLFAIYVDDLSQGLAMCKSGCYIDDQCINHVMYADDICLLAPSAIGRVGKMPAFMSKVHAGGIYRYLPAFTGIYRRLLEFTDVY